MKRIISTYSKIPKKEVYDCRITSLREVLRHYGISTESYSAFILGKGIDFMYGHATPKNTNGISFWVCGATPFSVEEEMAISLKVDIDKYTVENKEALWNKIKNYVDRDIPLISAYDPKALTEIQLGVSSKNSDSILDINFPSAGVIAGYDDEKQSVYFICNDIDKEVGISEYELDDFIFAICKENYLFSPNKTLYEFKFNEENMRKIKDNEERLIKDALIDICDRMLSEYSGSDVEFDDGSKVKCRGVEAIKSLGNDISEFEEYVKQQKEKGKNDLVRKFCSIRAYVLRASLLKGSNTCFRGEFAESLEYISHFLNISELEGFGKQFDEIATEWRDFTRKLSNLIKVENNQDVLLSTLSKKLYKIADLEQEAFVKLRSLLI
ncbi:DUF4872 domain-containing protein [Clostridium fungisolvens]|uniref:Butirosin biosynthesis protein H N-terminal domain-containing protein n=1 Tax=Clostridium fungisolvens TaxID=1604897 RepID=A0A6V8SS67_9CLOT|nr:DUF4872 domain-containing protein [Clostridium fungisolvens]GFP77743.1 hypothetical protein bsdtw1_03914 [Clostridium fungisolvens]